MAENATCRESDPQVRIAGFLKRSAANGPGLRSVIWAQGCPIHCPGCFNPDLWIADGGEEIAVGSLVEMILCTAGIEGITLTGGEPFFQAGPLAELAKNVQSHGLSVLTFSGHPYDLLISSEDRSWQRLIEHSDLLVTGPYRHKGTQDYEPTGWRGKEIHDRTGRIDWKTWIPAPDTFVTEYVVTRDGTVTATGYPDPSLTERMAIMGTRRGG